MTYEANNYVLLKFNMKLHIQYQLYKVSSLTTKTVEGTFEPKHEVSRVNVVGRVGDGLTAKLADLGIFVLRGGKWTK